MITNVRDLPDQPIKRFWVEATAQYYPSGGLADIQGQYATREEADRKADEIKGQYDYVVVHDILEMIVDRTTDDD